LWTDSARGVPNPLTPAHKDHPADSSSELHAALACLGAEASNAEAEALSGAGTAGGDQADVGQFLYLEGHEYLM
jgi:hypothetical protein